MKNYTKKWIVQRITAFILIPLTFWFVYKSISFLSMSYDQVIFFFSSIFNVFFFYIMIIAMLIHGKLGCETIIEDYIYSRDRRNYIKLLINIITYMFILLITLSTLKIILFA